MLTYGIFLTYWENRGLIQCLFGATTGYSNEYIEEVLHKKKEEKATLAIDLHRPTYIKVNRKYLHPDTLDVYGLPWEWDAVRPHTKFHPSAGSCAIQEFLLYHHVCVCPLSFWKPIGTVLIRSVGVSQRDDQFIIIKRYIDHELQDELFEHTRKLKERKLITGPYIKETKTITKLTPNDGFVKKGDKMFVVREKSKSRSPAAKRTSWMLT